MLIHNWKDILKRAWSIRLMLLAGLLTGLSVAVELIDADLLGISPLIFAAVAGLVNMAALIARLLPQARLDG